MANTPQPYRARQSRTISSMSCFWCSCGPGPIARNAAYEAMTLAVSVCLGSSCFEIFTTPSFCGLFSGCGAAGCLLRLWIRAEYLPDMNDMSDQKHINPISGVAEFLEAGQPYRLANAHN